MKVGLAGLLFLGLVSCADKTPTSLDQALIPAKPATVEIRLPWSQFGSDFAVYGGFGYPYQLGTAVVASTFGGLQAKAIAEFSGFATDALVKDSAGTLITDTAVSVVGGRVVVQFDTATSNVPGKLTLALGALQQKWDPVSVSWTMTVDTTGDHQAWSQPGGGKIVPLTTTTWTPDSGDSIVFNIDSTVVASLGDTATLVDGIVVSSLSPDTRLHVTSMSASLVAKTKINTDTTLYLTSSLAHMTFMYSPAPPAPTGEVRVGGVPAWRTVMRINVPDSLDNLPVLCAVVACPMKLTADQVNYAALVLHTDFSDPAFQPSDSVGLDVRRVLSPEALPKAPLSTSMLASSTGFRVPSFYFNRPGGVDVEVPITGFVRDLISSDTTAAGLPLSHVLALLAASEPASVSYATFQGPSGAQPPLLKLIITGSKAVVLP